MTSLSLREQIEKDVICAMKAKDAVRVSTLRMLKSAIGNYLITARKEKAEDAELRAIIIKQAKQRRESVESYEQAGRTDLAEKEKAELLILESYLPKQLSDEELANLRRSKSLRHRETHENTHASYPGKSGRKKSSSRGQRPP